MSLCLMWCSCSCSQQPLIGCRLLPLSCCLLTSTNNRSLVRLNVSLPHVVLLLLLAANNCSLVVGCCCCLSGVALLLLAANSRSLVVGCCLSGASMSFCLMWWSCSCSQQPLIGCRLLLLLPLWCCLQPKAKRLQSTAVHWL